jgi:hypothetical protein
MVSCTINALQSNPGRCQLVPQPSPAEAYERVAGFTATIEHNIISPLPSRMGNIS